MDMNIRRRRRATTFRRAGWLAVASMTTLALFGPNAGVASAVVAVSGAGNVSSISVGDCVPQGGIIGTLNVSVSSAPFVFHIWVTDHIRSESTFVEIPGSRQTLTVSASDSAFPFGPLDTSQHRSGINTMRVETDASTAKSASIPPCGPPTPTPTPTPTPDFSLALSPTTQSVRGGASVVYTVTVTSLNQIGGAVSLSVSGLPSGSSGSFNPTSVTPTSTYLLTIRTAATPRGTFRFTVRGTSGSLSRTTIGTLKVR